MSHSWQVLQPSCSLTCDWCGQKIYTHIQLQEHQNFHKMIDEYIDSDSKSTMFPNIHSFEDGDFYDTRSIQVQKLQDTMLVNTCPNVTNKSSNTDLQPRINYLTTLQHNFITSSHQTLTELTQI